MSLTQLIFSLVDEWTGVRRENSEPCRVISTGRFLWSQRQGNRCQSLTEVNREQKLAHVIQSHRRATVAQIAENLMMDGCLTFWCMTHTSQHAHAEASTHPAVRLLRSFFIQVNREKLDTVTHVFMPSELDSCDSFTQAMACTIPI